MKILSLFDGVSCARLALERAGVEVTKYFASEIDKYAVKVTQTNRPDTEQLGSAVGLNFLQSIDLLIGGSPCQDLSIAKKDRQGLEGSRSSLFYEYVRILNEVKPRYFILENVASMRKSDQDIITKELFGIQPIMINAALVSAQNRKRLFWVGKLERVTPQGVPLYSPVHIEQPEDKQIYLKDILENGDVDRLKSYCIDANYYKGANWDQYKTKGRRQLVVTGCASRTWPRTKVSGQPRRKRIEVRNDGKANNLTSVQTDSMIRIGEIGKGGQGNRIYSSEGKAVSISANSGGIGSKTGLYMMQKPRGNNKGGVRAANGKTPCLTSSRWDVNNHLVDGDIIRKLTPVECERLQGMPDNWTNPTGDISNTQRYKMCGNAFNVDVVAHIIKQLF